MSIFSSRIDTKSTEVDLKFLLYFTMLVVFSSFFSGANFKDLGAIKSTKMQKSAFGVIKYFLRLQHLSRFSTLMHADRDIAMAYRSVRLSVCHTQLLHLNNCIYRQNRSTIW